MPSAAILFNPAKVRPAGGIYGIVYLHDDSKAIDAQPGGPIEKLVKAGIGVYACDVRGVGETAPVRASPPRHDYFGAESKEAFLALHLGRPLLGQRLEDVWAPWAGGEWACDEHLLAIGGMGPTALHLAVLEPRFKSLTLDRSLISWSSVVRTPLSQNQLTNAVPGVLEYYDLPDLAATLAPRPLTIRNPVDAAGQPVSQEELERVYAKVKEAYAKAGAANRLKLEAAKK